VTTIRYADLTPEQLAETLAHWGEPMTKCGCANGRLWLIGGVLEVHSDEAHALDRVAIYGGGRVVL
jgi:hypothetical protein